MELFNRFSAVIEQTDFCGGIPRELLLREGDRLSTYYAPFDFINMEARLIICGITPGFKQAMLALNEAKAQLAAGATPMVALREAKNTASFGGPMRKNLVRMLDFIGIPKTLGIPSASSLFGEAKMFVHYTSALRYPVFLAGQNYNGTPEMTTHPDLRWQLHEHLSEEVARLEQALIVPLGPKVEAALDYLVQKGVVNPDRILAGLPHPSGANNERIAFFLDQKHPSELSSKTNPDKLLKARQSLLSKVAALGTNIQS
ncbi:hypothetical protein VB738_01295 [Cyanobium gracile UHCC 0139]|uniref:Uracil DNA glycosylase superfamily protein n=1 Tax=Cyanobium gracile UHCC 0139 TaxID=3110308 RepID=A0ABU5RQ46_9CYAN|nr:hypothetical protein [Cyanobium gracile]MEA5389884.1 hypothetical protein [Cyanobium gracile UHCC 0139]